MSNSSNNPPPDDHSKTAPNIPVSREDSPNDWDKTNYNQKYSPQPPADDWGKTVANYNIPSSAEQDFDKTFSPGAEKPKTPDWGMTEANINIAQDDFAGQGASSGGRGGGNESYGATTPYFRLPEAERAKYQNLPPTPAEQAAQQKEEEKKKGGLPSWLLVSGGLLGMFVFAVIVLLLVWFFFLNKTGFNVTVKSLPPRSDVYVDGTKWGVSNEDGSIILQSLKGGATKKIEIKHPNFTCQPREVKGENGEMLEITAQCSQNAAVKPPPTDDCQNLKSGEFEKAERCANQALDNLKEPFTPEDLAKALNLYIINFAVNKWDIPPKNMDFLKRASEYMKKLPPTTVIEVGGHTDSDGTDAKNQVLSENRAKAVYEALIKFGVNASMLTQKGYGETKPKPNNQNRNADEKFQNRRIEYTVIKK